MFQPFDLRPEMIGQHAAYDRQDIQPNNQYSFSFHCLLLFAFLVTHARRLASLSGWRIAKPFLTLARPPACGPGSFQT
jgi:hypothetical protein